MTDKQARTKDASASQLDGQSKYDKGIDKGIHNEIIHNPDRMVLEDAIYEMRDPRINPDGTNKADGIKVMDDDTDRVRRVLMDEYTHYRTLSLVLLIIGFSTLMISLTLATQGIITSAALYNILMTIAYSAILLTAIFFFMRARPLKKRIKQIDGQPTHTITDPDAPDGVRVVEENKKLGSMDELYSILERQARTEVIPENDEEYLKMRKTWISIFIAAAAAAIIAIALYLILPSAQVIATIIMVAAFVLVIVAFYYDRTKLRPRRVAYARQFGMSEMALRNQMKWWNKKDRNR